MARVTERSIGVRLGLAWRGREVLRETVSTRRTLPYIVGCEPNDDIDQRTGEDPGREPSCGA